MRSKLTAQTKKTFDRAMRKTAQTAKLTKQTLRDLIKTEHPEDRAILREYIRELPQTELDTLLQTVQTAPKPRTSEQDRERTIVSASLAECRKTITDYPKLTDKQAFALHVLCDFAQIHLDSANPASFFDTLTKLQTLFSVRVSSDAQIHSV